ncbi:Chitinase A1 precursor [compost metagenome]
MVRARNGVLHSGFSNSITVYLGDGIKPSKPTNLRFWIIEGFDKVLLNWDAATDNIAVKEYHIYYGYEKIATVPVGSHGQWINLADKGAYRVRAVDTAENFADSDPLVLPGDGLPGRPSHLIYTAVTNNSVTLNWRAADDGVSVTHYEVYRGGSLIDTTYNTSYVDGRLADGTYVYTVRSRNEVGSSNDSVPLSVRVDGIPPTKPTNLRATIHDGKTLLTWTKSTDNVAVTRYEISQNGFHIDTVESTSGDIQGLIIDEVLTTWKFKVRALDAAGGYADSDLLIGP